MKLGGLDISTVKLGANQVQAVYQGVDLVWQNAPVATAATGVGQTSFTANWNAYSGATYYLLDVSEFSDFSTFVYENQITTSTSYVVIGLNSNTTYYYRVRANVGYDSDAQAFFDRVTTAGGSLSTTEQDAVNTLVIEMKADGIWTKMKAIYPMVGGGTGTTPQRQAACAQNLKSSSFTGTFTAGWTFSNSGIKGDGAGATMDTGLNTNTELNKNSAHISYYSNDNYSVTNPLLSNNTLSCFIQQQSSIYYTMLGRNGFTQNSNLTIEAFYLTTRQSSIVLKSTLNGSVIGTDTNPSISFSSVNIFLNRYQATYTDSRCAFCSIGDGLSDAESLSCYNAVQAFNTTLSRQV
jgi:hypothetical protein